MNIKEEIKNKLEKYPELKYEEGGSSIYIFPLNEEGFTIGLEENGTSFTVSFDGWHESFESAEEALNCVGFGLSDSCRLKTIYRGKTPQKWVMEFKENNEWVMNSETGLIFFPFWRKQTIVYKQNFLIRET